MTYLGWVALYEGRSDAAYYNVLLPRIMDEITRLEGSTRVIIPQAPAFHLDVGRNVEKVADELCHNAESFYLIFIHTDTGGRNLEAGMEARGAVYGRAVHDLCGWPSERCVIIGPRHETEAWVLADSVAMMDALGLAGEPDRYGLPPDAAAAEALPDPKAVLTRVVTRSSHRRPQRKASTVFARVAQEQRLEMLRGSRSFRAFEADLRRALANLGCL